MCVNRFIIEQDLKRLGVTDFYIEEKVVVNPKVIPLQSNEILYVNYFNVTADDFIYFVKLQSNDNSHKYYEKNTKRVGKFNYESDLLLRFNTSVKIVNSSGAAGFDYFIQAYLVTINTHKTQCQDKNE